MTRIIFLICILSCAGTAYSTPITFSGQSGSETVSWAVSSDPTSYFNPQHQSFVPETFTLADGETKILGSYGDYPTGLYATETNIHLSYGLPEPLEFSFSTIISGEAGYPYQNAVVADVTYGGVTAVIPLGQMVSDPGSPWGLNMYPDFRPASVDLTLSDGNILQFAYVYDMYTDDFIYDTFRVTNLGRQHAPEPGTVFLFGAGLASLFFFSNRKQRNRLGG